MTHKKKHNFISGVSVKLIILSSQLILVPIFISNLGIEKYGEWLILTTIPNYLILSDLGLNQTVSNEICRLIAINENTDQQKIFKSAFSLLVLFGIIIASLLLIAFTCFNVEDIFNFNKIHSDELILIFGFYVLNVIIFLLLRLLLGYYKALDKYYLHEYALFITYALDLFATIFILYFSYALYYIPLSYIFIRLILFILVNIHLRKVLDFEIGFTKDLSHAKRLIPASIKLSLFSMGFALILQGTTFLVGYKLGSIVVVTFNSLRTLTNSLKAFLSVLYLPSMTEFAVLMAQNKKEIVKKKLKTLMLNTLVIALISSIGFYIFKDRIIVFWLKENLVYSDLFLFLMFISIIVQIVWNAATMLPFSINQLNTVLLFPLLCIIFLIYQFFSISRFGLVGLGAGFVILDLFMLFIVNKNNKQILK
jgi:O-antigen/teichoic acid export membrane protein